MWRTFFELCDFFVGFIPNRDTRDRIRRDRLYNFRKKMNALRMIIPKSEFKNVKLIKGGWNIGFIVNNNAVYKIRKHYENGAHNDRIIREKRITDAFTKIVKLQIPKIEIIECDGYTFYKYNFIRGKNMNFCGKCTIERNKYKWAKQLAQFIYDMHCADPAEIADLKVNDGDGWHHNDICNNVIINKKTKDIVGIIDWEYAGWGPIKTEFNNTAVYSSKMRQANFSKIVEEEYKKIISSAG